MSKILEAESREELVYWIGWLDSGISGGLKLIDQGANIEIDYEAFCDDYWKILFRLDELNEIPKL